MPKLALILSSTRQGNRLGPRVVEWIKPILDSGAGDATITTVDVADYNLPVFDEKVAPIMVPAMAQWTTEHAKKWSEEIAKYDGYILLANEYNFGMSSSTKNAIDYLYHAWIGKPVLIASYGIMGGSNASDQLKTVLTGMNLKVAKVRPQLGFFGGSAGEDKNRAFGGVLGEDTRKDWDTNKKSEILQGLKEVKKLARNMQPSAM